MSKRPRRRYVIGCVSLLIVAGLAWWGWSTLQAPAEGSISNAPVAEQPKQTTSPKLATQTGNFASFTYPSDYTSRPTATPVAPMVASYDFKQPGWQAADITVAIYQTPSITDLSAYQLRKQHPERFTLSSHTIGHQTVIEVQDTTISGPNTVAFLEGGGHTATISVQGTSDASTLAQTLQTFISSWQWR